LWLSPGVGREGGREGRRGGRVGEEEEEEKGRQGGRRAETHLQAIVALAEGSVQGLGRSTVSVCVWK